MEQEKKNFTDRYNNLLNDLKAEVINLVKSNPYYENSRLNFDNYASNEAAQDILMDNIIQGYDDYASSSYDAYVRKICVYNDEDICVIAFAPNLGNDVDDVTLNVDTLYTLWHMLTEINKCNDIRFVP